MTTISVVIETPGAYRGRRSTWASRPSSGVDALIDRLVHRATMVTLKGKSYRLRERGTDTAPKVRPSRHTRPTELS